MQQLRTAAASGTRSIAKCLAFHAQQRPNALAVTEAGGGAAERSISFAELDRRSSRLAHAYAAALGDVNPFGRIITLALPNSIELMTAACACWKLGGTPQPVDPRAPTSELRRILEAGSSAMVVGVDAERHAPLSSVCQKVLPRGFEADETMPTTAPANGELIPPHYKAPLSGGSTGKPKVILSNQPGEFDPEHDDFLFTSRGGAMLIPGPCSHNVPFMWSTHSLIQGKHTVQMRRFDAADSLRLLAKHRCDYTPMV